MKKGRICKMDQFNVNGAKKVSKNESVNSTEKGQNTPSEPGLHWVSLLPVL